MTSHLKMDRPDHRRRLDNMAQGTIGTAMARPDGPAKVTGTAIFAHEAQPEGMVHGVLVRAPVSKGRLVAIDMHSLHDLPGILDILSGDRFLRNPAQGGANKAPVQGSDDIAYFGQPIALVVAETFEQARHGALMLQVKIEPQEGAVVDPQSAEYETPEGSQDSQGDLEAAMSQAAHAIDVIYTTPSHNSAPMEPHAAIADWKDGVLTLHGSYQMLKFNRNELADAVGVAPDKVRILAPYIGGGFGSKLGIAPEAVSAALAAEKLGRPVGVALTRQQVFEATIRRSETRQRIRLAADGEGRLSGVGHEAWVSNLPGESFAEPVTQATPFLYQGAHRVIGQHIARLDRTCAGSVRAPGEAVGVTILESAMDELAEAAGIDPVELRLRNIPDEDPSTRKPFSSRRFREALTRGAEEFGWSRRTATPRSTRDGEWLIGTGMASAVRVNILAEAKARVTLSPDGRALVETDMTDIGTGTYSILTQIAAEMLGLTPSDVVTTLGDTDLPPGPGSGGSHGAASSGSAVFLACEDLRRQIADRLHVGEGDLTLRDGAALHDNRRVPLADIINSPLSAVGHCEPGKTSDEVRQATFGACFAEVATSAVTGETRVRRMLGVFSAGRILNARTAQSQCLGGMTFGIGMALTEELMHDPRDGHIVNRDLAEYHLPVNADVPQIDAILLEERDDWASPIQAKGIGELSICGAGAAITNAIHNATGVRVRDYPATLDKVLKGLMTT